MYNPSQPLIAFPKRYSLSVSHRGCFRVKTMSKRPFRHAREKKPTLYGGERKKDQFASMKYFAFFDTLKFRESSSSRGNFTMSQFALLRAKTTKGRRVCSPCSQRPKEKLNASETERKKEKKTLLFFGFTKGVSAFPSRSTVEVTLEPPRPLSTSNERASCACSVRRRPLLSKKALLGPIDRLWQQRPCFQKKKESQFSTHYRCFFSSIDRSRLNL